MRSGGVQITLDGVCVDFRIYDARGRSLRGGLLRWGTGGRIAREDGRVIVTALDGISLSLRDGDRLGLVGHNGAGKSTLLRLLAGIYAPSRGAAHIRGSAVPLFDMTMGFDPECTGRENIRLRGLLLGMPSGEIGEREQEIIEFSELGGYIDLPLRTYSSGMMVRLAFAIATTRVPEILLLDEMIGMADAQFLERAERRLDGFLSSAGIIVLASHSEDVIRRTCNKAALLQHGKLVGLGSVDEIFASYASLGGSA